MASIPMLAPRVPAPISLFTSTILMGLIIGFNGVLSVSVGLLLICLSKLLTFVACS
jgi:hypothetical protein